MVVITRQQAAERLSPVFKGRRGKLLFDLACRITGIAKVNAGHDRLDQAGIPYGPPFAHAILEEIGVDFRVGNPERLASLPEGPFIVIANHVYGHIDGICLLDLFGHQRPETKVMVNESLKFLRTKEQHEVLQQDYDAIAEEEADDLSISDIPPDVIQQMLSRLPTGYRTVLNLFVFEGKSHQEIARLLGIRKDSSASQLLRAKQMLIKMIRKYNNDNPPRR